MGKETKDQHHIIGGVDTHKDLHVAAVVDAKDRFIASESFATTRQGYRLMLEWMQSFGDLQRVGVEATGTYADRRCLHAGDLSVNVNGVKNNSGTIRVVLHDKARGFPGDRQPYAVQEVGASPGSVTVRFAGLAPGLYAISFFHDENGNKKLDTNLLGLPKEGYGFSNNATAAFGPPDFQAARFQVGGADSLIKVDVNY